MNIYDSLTIPDVRSPFWHDDCKASPTPPEGGAFPLAQRGRTLLPKGVLPFCLKGVLPFCPKGSYPFAQRGFTLLPKRGLTLLPKRGRILLPKRGAPQPPKGGFTFCIKLLRSVYQRRMVRKRGAGGR